MGGHEARIREGDVLGPYRVATIEPSGIVLERDGKTLRRDIGAR